MRYIAVFHEWFVSSSGWRVRELDVESEEEAHKEASAMAFGWDKTFNHCDYTLLPIGSKETLINKRRLVASRKLTLKERVLGKIFDGAKHGGE